MMKKDWEEMKKECNGCNGKGFIGINARTREKVMCQKCKGTGKKLDKKY